MCLRSFVVAFLLLTFPTGLSAQDEARNEFWPELNVFYRLDASYRLFFFVAPAFSDNNFTEGQVGAHIEMGLFPILRTSWKETYDVDRFRFVRFRAGIQRATNQPLSENPSKEWRGVAELTPRWSLPFDILSAFRNRLELRWLDDDYSTRYRGRLTLERDTEIFWEYTIVPYASVEMFYDWRFDVWNRVRYQLGFTFPIIRLLALETYYLHQNDWRSQPARLNAFGLVGILYF